MPAKRSAVKKRAENENKKIRIPVQKAQIKGKTNYDLLSSQSYEGMCDCLEYIFLLRETFGSHGFIRMIKYYPDNLEPAWEEIEKDDMINLFHGRRRGFMSKWLTKKMYEHMRTFDSVTWARWLTFFDTFPQYRLEILKGRKHNLLSGKFIDEDILGWLEETA